MNEYKIHLNHQTYQTILQPHTLECQKQHSCPFQRNEHDFNEMTWHFNIHSSTVLYGEKIDSDDCQFTICHSENQNGNE